MRCTSQVWWAEAALTGCSDRPFRWVLSRGGIQDALRTLLTISVSVLCPSSPDISFSTPCTQLTNCMRYWHRALRGPPVFRDSRTLTPTWSSCCWETPSQRSYRRPLLPARPGMTGRSS